MLDAVYSLLSIRIGADDLLVTRHSFVPENRKAFHAYFRDFRSVAPIRVQSLLLVLSILTRALNAPGIYASAWDKDRGLHHFINYK